MRRQLKFQLFEATGIDKNKQSVKMTEAPVIKPNEKGTFAVYKEGAVVQADLIYMRKDVKGFEYILSVVDVATRKFDAEPLRGRTSTDVIEGFEQIWKRKHVSKDIGVLYTDPGSEFKNKDFQDYMKSLDIPLRFAMTNRKNQMSIVEMYNHFITKTIGTKLTSNELETNEHQNDWASILPKIVEVLNKQENLKVPKLSSFFGDPKTTVKELEERLEEGTVVHVRLQAPKDHLRDTNNRLHGGFRNGDVRWDQKPTEVINVVIVPNQPIRYLVKGIPQTSFLRKELLVADAKTTEEYRRTNPYKRAQGQPQPEIKQAPTRRGIIKTRSITKQLQEAVNQF